MHFGMYDLIPLGVTLTLRTYHAILLTEEAKALDYFSQKAEVMLGSL